MFACNTRKQSHYLPWSQVGLHQAAVRCLPLFLLYLGTLMHTYSLSYLQARCLLYCIETFISILSNDI